MLAAGVVRWRLLIELLAEAVAPIATVWLSSYPLNDGTSQSSPSPMGVNRDTLQSAL